MNHKRKGVGQLFDITTSTSDSQQSSTPSHTMSSEEMSSQLYNSIRRKWPSMDESTMSIRSDDVYESTTAETLFNKAITYLNNVKDIPRTDEHDAVLQNEVDNMMMHAIFGSNSIERAGLGLDVTIHICLQVLRGENIEFDERSPEYAHDLSKLVNIDSSLRGLPTRNILRGRQEIVQHAKAFQYLIHHFVVLKGDMTESLIKETHRILCHGVSIIQQDSPDIPSEEYGGKYRTVIVGAGSTNFVVPQHVPNKMAKLCEEIKADVENADGIGEVDPFSLATKHSLEFVQIHPFQDGNGRMCRLILNAILFRYTGIFIAIGEREDDRTEYMNIKKRSSDRMEGHGEYASFVLDKAVRTIRKLKQKLHGKK